MGREEGRRADDVVHPADPGDGHQEAASEQHLGVLVRLLQVQVSRRRRLGKVDEQGDGLLVFRDPTECDSYLGALVCDGGADSVGVCGGRLLQSNPLQTESPWKCQHCGKVTQSGQGS